QQLRRGRRRRAAVRRGEALGARAREGLRGAVRLLDAEDGRDPSRAGLMRLQNKSAIVTGGGSGFGEGIVRKFVAEGARVLIADRDEGKAKRGAEPPGAQWVRADVSSAADVAAMIGAAVERFGALDVLVNNAGIGHLPQPLEGLPEDEFDRILAVN